MCGVSKVSNSPVFASPETGSAPNSPRSIAQQIFNQDVLSRNNPSAASTVCRGAPALPNAFGGGGKLDDLLAQFEAQQSGKKNGVDVSNAPTSLATSAAQATAVNASDGGSSNGFSDPLSGLGGAGGSGDITKMLGGLIQQLMPMIMKAIMSFI
jgi:hypothetical protein